MRGVQTEVSGFVDAVITAYGSYTRNNNFTNQCLNGEMRNFSFSGDETSQLNGTYPWMLEYREAGVPRDATIEEIELVANVTAGDLDACDLTQSPYANLYWRPAGVLTSGFNLNRPTLSYTQAFFNCQGTANPFTNNFTFTVPSENALSPFGEVTGTQVRFTAYTIVITDNMQMGVIDRGPIELSFSAAEMISLVGTDPVITNRIPVFWCASESLSGFTQKSATLGHPDGNVISPQQPSWFVNRSATATGFLFSTFKQAASTQQSVTLAIRVIE